MLTKLITLTVLYVLTACAVLSARAVLTARAVPYPLDWTDLAGAYDSTWIKKAPVVAPAVNPVLLASSGSLPRERRERGDASRGGSGGGGQAGGVEDRGNGGGSRKATLPKMACDMEILPPSPPKSRKVAKKAPLVRREDIPKPLVNPKKVSPLRTTKCVVLAMCYVLLTVYY